MRSLANSEEPDEMPHNVAFRQVYTVCYKKELSSAIDIHFIYIYYTIELSCEGSSSLLHQTKSILFKKRESNRA